MSSRIKVGAAMAAALIAVCSWVAPGRAHADDPGFYQYTGSRPLASYPPGAVLKTRTLTYHIASVAMPLPVVQILYRTTNALGRPIANVTSVVEAPDPAKPAGLISYQSMYDSLNPADGPSRLIAGNLGLGQLTPIGHNIKDGDLLGNFEDTELVAAHALGFAVNIPDTESQEADFAAGPEYGMTTLDSLRAASSVQGTGVTAQTRIGLAGYSGGSIATNWAASLAPSYAPEIDKRLVGAAEGGVLVDPAHNLNYASGSLGWAGVVGMAVAGIGRAYHIGFGPYISGYGTQVLRQLSDASILNGWYPGLTWQQVVKPQFADPKSVPPFLDVVNKINMGTAPVPTTPMFIDQGANGAIEGTAPSPTTGPGDGIMVTGDVRALANRYCSSGLPVDYHQYDMLSHVMTALLWAPQALHWLADRFAGVAAPSTCGSIPPGNSLAPLTAG